VLPLPPSVEPAALEEKLTNPTALIPSRLIADRRVLCSNISIQHLWTDIHTVLYDMI
jgi:hypothetical protein